MELQSKIEAKSLYYEPNDIQPLKIWCQLVIFCKQSDGVTWCVENIYCRATNRSISWV